MRVFQNNFRDETGKNESKTTYKGINPYKLSSRFCKCNLIYIQDDLVILNNIFDFEKKGLIYALPHEKHFNVIFCPKCKAIIFCINFNIHLITFLFEKYCNV